MKQSNYIVTFIIISIFQILICNYLNLTQYILLSILPLAILCLPIKINTLKALLIAFITGLAVDFFAEGIIGLNTLALVPVALLRYPVISLVFGPEVFARKENISVVKHGAFKMSTAIIFLQGLFLLIYIWADGAWARTFVFNLTRFSCSLLAGYIVSFTLSFFISEDITGKWK